jgi:nucleoside-binding protein
MKWMAILVAACLLLPIAGALRSEAENSIKVGVVFDIGGRGDKSFNDATFEGVEWAREAFGIEYKYAEPGPGGADRENLLRMMARGKMDLVIGVGFLFTSAVLSTAKDYPNVKFACVDMAVDDPSQVPENVVALKFKEQEGSFLVGVIAGLKTKSNIVGFVGGMDMPLINKFEAGYHAGVKYINPDCRILSAYAGVTGQAFNDPDKGYELAYTQNRQGADIIYHASGNTGTGVFKAAKERGFYVIGVDSNQNYMGHDERTGKNWGLTSMEKRCGVAVYLAIESVVNGDFTSGINEYGLKDYVTIGNKTYRAIDFSVDEYNKGLLDEKTIAKVNEIAERIVNGEIKVPTSMDEV